MKNKVTWAGPVGAGIGPRRAQRITPAAASLLSRALAQAGGIFDRRDYLRHRIVKKDPL
jgi:hypothetical protein